MMLWGLAFVMAAAAAFTVTMHVMSKDKPVLTRLVYEQR